MAQYTYTAINKGGKQLNGIIGALSEEEARKQLNILGISILTIKQSAETPTQTATAEPATTEELPKFEFEAFDKTGKKVVGTIPASSRYKAFQRLVDEYDFEISFIVQTGATPEKKEKAKQEDLTALKKEYEIHAHTKGEKVEETGVITPEFERKRKALLNKVDFILGKIKTVLKDYETDIKPENKKLIQDYIDKLLRIRSSTNLDYIEHTSEQLLKKVQDQELFLHKEKMANARSKLKLESQKLMSELHARPSEKKDLTDDLAALNLKLEGSKIHIFKGLSNFIKKFLPTPEEKELKQLIRTVNKQVWTFRRIWLTSPKLTKPEAYRSLQKIMEEKKRLVAELKALKTKQKDKKQEQTAEQTAPIEKGPTEPLLLEEINSFLGWLLGFYLTAYFAGHYVLAKVIPSGNPLPGNFNLLSSPILRYLLISVFLWYMLVSLRLQYLRYKPWANGLVIVFGILLNASLIFNL